MSDAKTLLTTMMMLRSLFTDGYSDGIKDFWADLDQKNRQKKQVYDPEWKEAESADEEKRYYWLYMSGGGRCVKFYKPSVANLYAKRTGLRIIPVAYTRKAGESE